MTVLKVRGFEIHKAFLSPDAQKTMVERLREVAKAAPFFQPRTPYGKSMTVRMTAAGSFGWYADQSGYRYVPTHPSGRPWPEIPAGILDIWNDLTGAARAPECCLINYYGPEARMGLHQDRDEADFQWPVVSISLGDDGLFRMGNTARGGKTESIWLQSGDVVVMGGAARLSHHGVDRIKPGTSRLLPQGGRLNITLRVVT